MDSKRHRLFDISAQLAELKQGLRRLRRLPGFSATAILTLALAISANTVVFSLVDGILLSPLPYPESDRIASLWMASPAFANNARIQQSPATYLHFAGESRTFDSVTLAAPQTVVLDDGVRAERLQAARVTPSIHHVLGLPIAHGRELVAADTLPGAEPVVVLGHGLWTERFGRDPDVTSRFLEIDRTRHRVISVLPPGLAFPASDTQVWLPLTIDPAAPTPLDFRYAGYGRLAPGVDPDTARQDLDRLIHTLPEAYPEGFSRDVIEQAEITARVRTLKEEMVGDVRPALWTLLASMLAILLIASVNLTNLFAVRTEGRRRDLAIRSALGADRGSLRVSVAAEGLWLVLIGTGLGLGLGALALNSLQVVAPENLPRLQDVRLDLRVAAVTAGLSFASGLLAGLLPAWTLRWRSLSRLLQSSSAGAGGGPLRLRLRQVLVTLQVALALVLVVASGLLMRSYHTLSRVEPGFASEDVLTFRLSLPEAAYGEWSQAVSFFHQLLERVRALPGVEHAAAASTLPLGSTQTMLAYRVESDPVDDKVVRPTAQTVLVSEDYLATLQVPLVEGRMLERRDAETKNPVAVVNQAFADHHWPAQSAVGEGLLWGSSETRLEVVGVVGDTRHRLVESPLPILYLPLVGPEGEYSFARKEMSLAIRVSRGQALVPAIRTALADMDRGVPIYDVRTLESTVAASAAGTRWTTVLLAVAAVSALFLAVVGLSGLMAYAVGRREREIGIRMALGASHRRVRSMVVAQALTLSGVGVAAGAAGALLLGRWLRSLLYQVNPRDPLVLVSAMGFLLLVAWLAADLPARRASRLNPADIVRGEE